MIVGLIAGSELQIFDEWLKEGNTNAADTPITQGPEPITASWAI